MADYIPILRWKRGERTALSHVVAGTRTGVKPLFVLGVDQFKARKATKSKPAVPAPSVVAMEVLRVWGQNPVYIDASALPVRSSQHPITAIHQAAQANGANIIPAATLGSSQQYLAAISQIDQAAQTGVALRVDLQELSTASNWVPAWQIPIARTDFVADFADNIATVGTLGNALDQEFRNLHQGPAWRSVATAGTSMPDNFQGYSAGAHLIPRIEKQLWERLSNSGLPYDLHYGDFANVSLAVPPPGIAWGYPINVKYTLENDFHICRGVKTVGQNSQDMDVQLTAHARTIQALPNRNTLTHCWGDQRIDAIAGGAPPQGLEQWVGFTVNRHVEIVRHFLP